jgi:hypothetical protein
VQAECAEAVVILEDTTFAAALYERLAPYAGRPITAGRAITNYGAADRNLAGLAALMGHRDRAVAHALQAIRVNGALGCAVWRARAERQLARLRGAEPG